MNDSARAMATWLAGLAKPTLRMGPMEKAGQSMANYVLGQGKLHEIRSWFAFQSDEVQERELAGTLTAIVYMAHADDELHETEREFLEKLIDEAGLSDPTTDELRSQLGTRPSLDGLSARITNTDLREVLLALSWEMAMADERIAPEEQAAYNALAQSLGVPAERAESLRDSLSAQV